MYPPYDTFRCTLFQNSITLVTKYPLSITLAGNGDKTIATAVVIGVIAFSLIYPLIWLQARDTSRATLRYITNYAYFYKAKKR